METQQTNAITFRIRLALLPEEVGGRSTAICDGYTPECWFGALDGHRKALHRCEIKLGRGATRLAGVSWLAPGESCEAVVSPLEPDEVAPWLGPGRLVEICEGTHVVGHGCVLHD